MATYYRWDKYNDYKPMQSEESDRNMPESGNIIYVFNEIPPIVNTQNGYCYDLSNPDDSYSTDTPNVTDVTLVNKFVSVYTDKKLSIRHFENGRIAYDLASELSVFGDCTVYNVSNVPTGSHVSVYSIGQYDYPNGGVLNYIYYGGRTTVTSPTAPSGLSYPATITTPSVDVTWTAANSNTNYPVNGYQVDVSTNGGTSWTLAGNPNTNSLTYSITPGVTSIMFRVRAKDSNGQWGSYVTGTASQVLLAPTLTVPQMLMQGQQATVNWTAIEGADSYTLQRKANTDTDWTQVYSGTALTFSETVGTWTTVQYRVQAVFSGTPGGWATSAEIPVVSASALVISGQDGDLGVVVNDIPYSISTDTGNQITATITVNGAVIFNGNVGNSVADVIPVLDLINGEGTIVIEASVTASSGPVSAVRTWTYTKTMMTFPNAGSIAELTKDGKVMWPETLAEAVRIPGGKTLDHVMGFPAQVYTGSYVGTGTYGEDNPTEITFPFEPDFWGFLGVVISGEFNTQAYQPFDPWGMNQIDHAGAVISCSYEGSTVKFTSNNAGNQKNTSGYEYYFIGIKIG